MTAGGDFVVSSGSKDLTDQLGFERMALMSVMLAMSDFEEE